MLRKLAIAIAASGALMSATSVHALGMGDIELDSALNQPLDAHIKLLKAGELEDWEIKPDLASTDEFQKSGIERVFFLNNVKFEIERSDEGVFIKLSTQEAVVEPFLNFLVQVDWPNGRLLREYTLLLDPPVFAAEPSAPVQAAQSEEFEAEPEMEDDLPGTGVSQPSSMEESADSYMDEEPVEAEDPQEDSSEDLVESEPEQETYEVRSNDTLWEVALKTRPNRSISPQQAMLAIQDLNPDSFINGNINRLKKNQVLRIPSEEQINARDFREAVSEVAVQNKVIKKRNAQLDATRKIETLDREEEVKGAELKLLTDGEATSETERSASGEVMSSTAGDQSTLDNELSLALENLDKSQRDNKELSNRLDALEEQINTLQRIINLKDEQMVALQAGFSQQDVAPDAAAISQPDQQVALEEAGLATSEVESETDSTASVIGEGTEQAADLNFAAPEEQVAKEEKPKKKVAPVIASEPVEEEFNLVTLVMDNIAIFGGALGALLLALLLVNRSRKNKDDEEFAEDVEMSSFEGADPLEQMSEELEGNLDDEFADLEMGGDIEGLVEDETSQGTDAGLEGSPEKEADSADVLGEVEIYIAYDRMDQARSLLEKTIEDQPGRMDVRVKLLEVLSAVGDSESFTEQYDHVISQGSEEDQGKANSYRESLDLDGGQSDSGLLGDLDDDLSLGDDFENQGSADLDFEGIELGSDEGDLDFDLDGLGLEDSDADEQGKDLTDFDASLDADLSLDAQDDDLSLEFGSLDLDSSSDADLSTSLESVNDDFDADLNFDMPELSDDEITSGASLSNDEAGALNSDLMDVDLNDGLSDEIDLDEMSLDLEADTDISDSSLLEESGDVDLGEMSLDLEEDSSSVPTSIDELEVEDLDLNLDEDMENFALDIDEGASDLDSQTDTLNEDFSKIESSMEASELEADLDLTLDEDLELDGIETLDSSDNLSLTDSELDLDLGIDESELPSIDGLDGDLLDDLDQLSVDLDVNDLNDDVPVIQEQVPADSQKSTFDLPSLEENDLDLTDLDGDLDFLSGTDESETKLDLARAYIDMDDQDGAREILEEVLEDGTEQQKQDAGRLMDSLA